MSAIVNSKEHNQQRMPYVSCIVIAVLILIGTVNSYFNLVALVFASLIIIFSTSISKVVSILLFTLPFSTIFKLEPNGNTFFNLLTAVAILKLLTHNIPFSYKEILSIIMFVIFVLIFGNINSFIPLTKLCLSFFLMLLIFNSKEKLNLYKILVFYSLGIIIASVIGLFDNYIPGLSQYIEEVKLKVEPGEYITRFSGIELNPNFYTMDISIALAAWFGIIVSKRSKPTDYLFIILLSVFGIMSLSKSFLLTFIILLSFLMIGFGKKHLKGVVKGIVFLVVVIGGLYIFVDQQYVDAFLSRIINKNNSNLSEVTTGRYDIWLNYLDYIFNENKVLFIGEGLGTENHGNASHNYYIETVYYLGIVGALLYLFCLKSIFPIWDKSIKRGFENYLPLIVLLIRGMAINLILRDNLIFYFIIIAVVLNTDFKIINREEIKEVKKSE